MADNKSPKTKKAKTKRTVTLVSASNKRETITVTQQLSSPFTVSVTHKVKKDGEKKGSRQTGATSSHANVGDAEKQVGVIVVSLTKLGWKARSRRGPKVDAFDLAHLPAPASK